MSDLTRYRHDPDGKNGSHIHPPCFIFDDTLQQIADWWKQEATKCKRYVAGDGLCVQCAEGLDGLVRVNGADKP